MELDSQNRKNINYDYMKNIKKLMKEKGIKCKKYNYNLDPEV